MTTVPGRSSHAHRASDPFAFVDADYASRSSVSFSPGRDSFDAGSPPDSLSAITSGPSSQTADRLPRPQTDSPVIPRPEITQHQSNKRSRTTEPRDPRAAKRLRTQREKDNDNIERLLDLFVPKGVERGMKKDRLSLVVSYATKHVKEASQQLQASFHQGLDVRGDTIPQSDAEGFFSKDSGNS